MATVIHDNDVDVKPSHIAIVMDGNGRWAQARGKRRTAGHRAGVVTTRKIVERCGEIGIKVLTLFAFSSENWNRPDDEVGVLMTLFIEALGREVKDLHKKNVRLEFIGERERLSEKLQNKIRQSEELTNDNTGLKLYIAVSYGGRWDICRAAQRVAVKVADGTLDASEVTEEKIHEHMALAAVPDPDLFIRTGGEKRISNFLLWNLAYAELYFSDKLWPDFSSEELEDALGVYASRQRRFGRVLDIQKHDAAKSEAR
ncbi:MAG: isoprenyl transferase [Gammaproteobacteria bacterium]